MKGGGWRAPVAASLVALAALVGLVAATGCTKKPTPGGPTTTTLPSLPFESSPSRADLEDITGLRFPDSTTGYRSARASDAELDVTFRMDPADADSFVADSGLPELRAERLLAHPSPVWSLDPGGDVRSTSTARDGMRIALEVVTPPATDGTPATEATVRLVVASGA